ncbi:MAG: C-terminal target protein, partial [Verrucomicrobiales bacterium]|nr:C-terminal target protein [Verrucomicrobiales bacterium]
WFDSRGAGTDGLEIAGPQNAYFAGLATTFALNDDVWHHVAWVRQGTHLYVYVDGTLNNTTITTAVADINNTANLKLGVTPCVGVDGTSAYSGAVDELSIFNRALSAAEIQAFYTANLSGKCQAPVITQQPTAVTANQNATVAFSVVAKGAFPLTYQWQKDGAAIAGATASTLTLVNVQPGSAGAYSVAVANSSGQATSVTAALAVIVPPVITQQPESAIVNTGGEVTFSVTATGSQPLVYQWKHNGVVIPGATASTYTINPTQPSDAGYYNVTVANAAGITVSIVADLSVNTAPVVVASGDPSVRLPGTASLNGSATDDNIPGVPLAYNWTLNSGPAPVEFGDASAANTYASFTVPGNYVFDLIVSDSMMEGYAQVSVVVLPPLNCPLANGSFETGLSGWAADMVAVAGPSSDASQGSHYLTFQFNHLEGRAGTIVQAFCAAAGQHHLDFDLGGELFDYEGSMAGVQVDLLSENGSTLASQTIYHTFPDVNFRTESESFTVPPGESVVTLRIMGLNDGASSASPILDNICLDATPVVTIRTIANATEPNIPGSFLVSRTGSTANPLTVYYCVGGSAANALDYLRLAGSVRIPRGQSSATVVVDPLVDNVAEGTETVAANLTAHSSYVIDNPSSAILYIADGSGTPSSPELIVNGGFENGTDGWETGFGGVVISTPNAPQGTHVAQLPSDPSFPNTWGVIGQGISVTPNTEYEVKFMSGKVGSDQTLSNLRLLVMSSDLVYRALNGDDELMGSVYASHDYFRSASDFSPVTFRFTAPANVTSAAIVFLGRYDGANSVIDYPQIDYVSVKAVPSTNPGLLVNGGFENGLNGWYSNFEGANGAVISTVNAPEGAHVAQLPLPANSSVLSSKVIAQDVSVIPNTEYVVQFMSGKAGSGGTLSDLSVRVVSVDWGFRAAGQGSEDELTGSIYASHDYLKSASDFSQETFRFTTPADVTAVSLLFYSRYDDVSGVTDSPQIDFISFQSASGNAEQSCFVVTTQPQSQQKLIGDSVTFTAGTSSGGTPIYQWKKNNVPISGATASAYIISNSQVSDAGNYSATISEGACTIDSPVAALTICSPTSCFAPPLLSSHICNQNVCPGDAVNFVVSATGTAPLTYQWRLNGQNITGASASAYSISSVQPTAFGIYDVVVSNPYGLVTSETFRLDVDSSCSIQITSQPQDQQACPGDSVTFSVTAVGPGTLSYQWKRDNVDISGATQSTYTITSVQPSDYAGYSVSTAVTGYPSVTSRVALLTPGGCSDIHIVVQPVDQQTCPGGSATFSVTAYGPGPLSYQWRKNGTDIVGATQSSYTIAPVQASDVGLYSVVVSAIGFPSVTSRDALLSLGDLGIVQQPESQVACLGGGVSLTVAASSTAVSYQWRKSGVDLANATDSAYTIPNVTLADAGPYTVTVFNSCGTITSDIAVLSVNNCAYQLINVDFGDWLPVSPKVGLAATGLSGSDFWNMVGPDSASGEFEIPNALDVGQAPTGVTIKANSADGVGFRPAAGVGSADAMFSTSRTSYNGDQIVVTVENLIAGVYDFYAYGHGVQDAFNTKFDLSVDSVPLPQKVTSHQPGWNTVNWQQGIQYVKFGGVRVLAGQTVTVTGSAGNSAKPWLNGIQISLPACQLPVINNQPANVADCPDSSATVSVDAEGNELTYQSSFNNSPITGATDSSYKIPAPTSANVGAYKVEVGGCAGNVVSTAATLTLLPSCKNVLFYEPTSGGLAANTPGIKVTVWNETQWAAASTADFAAFDAIVFGDEQPCFEDASVWQTAVNTRSVWSPAINGNVIILGTDPDWHKKTTLVEQSVLFAADAPNKTGLYVALSCALEGHSIVEPVELLAGIGRFTAIEADCGNDVHKIASHPVLNSIDDTYLSGWKCSTHEGFHEWPTGFKPLALVRDVPFDHETPGYPGLVYIVARGITSYCPDLTGGSFAGSDFQFNVNGNSGESVEIYASEDTVSWTQIGTITLTSDTAVFTDTDAGNHQHRYYHGVRGSCCTEALGFVRTTVPGKGTGDYGTALIANQLNTPPNTLSRLFPTMPEGTKMDKWDPSTLAWVPATFVAGGWDIPNVTLSPGEGAFVRNPSTDPLIITSIGRVLDGQLVNPMPAGRSVRSSMIPQAGFVDALGLSSFADNDAIEKWNSTTASYDTYTFSQGVWGPTTPSVAVGEAFFVESAAAFNWTRNYSACCVYPTITQQPVSQKACAGGSITFLVNATGSPLSYQWYLDGTLIADATGSSYIATSIDSTKVGTYTVSVSNPCGTITSIGATLQLDNPLILGQPQSQSGCPGGSVTFTVTASAGVSYQWAKDGVALAGGSDSSYTINPVTSADAGTYTVTIANACGSVTSIGAVLTVDPSNDAPIVNAGSDQTVTIIAGANLNGSASDDGRPCGSTLTTVWSYSGPGTVTFGDINSASTTATFSQPGIYTLTLTATDGALSASDQAVITVTGAYEWIDVDFGQQQTVSPKVGKAADGITDTDFWNIIGPGPADVVVTIPCALGVDQVPTGVAITASDLNQTGFDPAVIIGSADAMFNTARTALSGDELVVTLDSLAGGAYDFYLYGHGPQNSYNTAFEVSINGVVVGQKSTSAQPGWNTVNWQDEVQLVKFSSVAVHTSERVTIKAIGTDGGKPWLNGMQIFHHPCDPAVITQQPTDATVCSGNSATFSVVATGTGVTYQWNFNGGAISGATASSYTIPAAVISDAGSYSVNITGLCGTINSENAQLTVSTVPVITGQPLSVSTAIGSSVIFTVKAEPLPVTYQWAKDGVAIANASDSSYILPNVSQSDVGSYTVNVINTCGTTISTAALLSVHQGAVRPGFDTSTMPADPSDPDHGSGSNGDDGSTSAIQLGFSINYFCDTYDTAFINMNGNLTFLRPLTAFTPVDLANLGQPVIAPFWADVDTRPAASGKTTYGSGTVNGHPAFGVTWNHVGYASQHPEKQNRFQLVLISRPDLGPGKFDVEYNYDQIQWESADTSGGTEGLGGNSARVGFSDAALKAFELSGSAINGAFLDSNLNSGLSSHSLNSAQLGRYYFQATTFACDTTCSAPTLTAPSFDADGKFRFTIVGTPQTACALFSSTDAVTWTKLKMVPLSTGTATFIDENTTAVDQRYYRANQGLCCSEAIGFMKVTVPGATTGAYGIALIANQLNAQPNTIGMLMPTVPVGTLFSKWNGNDWVTATFGPTGWDSPNMTLAPGEGASIGNPSSPFVFTFCGKLLEGHLVNPVPAGSSIRSSTVPQAGTIDELGLAGFANDDVIAKWDVQTQTYKSYTYNQGTWSPSTPSIGLGESISINTASALNWVRDYSACCNAPVIIAQPHDATICVEQVVTLTVHAIANEPLAYQWKKGGVEISAATGSSYIIPSASIADSDNYTVLVSSSCASITSDPAVIVVNSCGINQAPTVNAGPDAPSTVGVATTLSGSASDDGLPAGSSVTVTWSVTPGVTFTDLNSANTTVTFDAVGTYTLTLTATDGDKTSSDQAVITVGVGPNRAPVVNAGPAQRITLPSNTATLNGQATDDGQPAGSSLTYAWTVTSGDPSFVTFANPNSAATTVTFAQAGAYTLTLTADDSQLTGSDDVRITVAAPLPLPPVVFSPEGSSDLPSTITLSVPGYSGAQIKYSADGVTWLTYSTPLVPTSAGPLQAYAISAGYQDSAITEHSFGQVGPAAVADMITVAQDSQDNYLAVTANDSHRASAAFSVASVSSAQHGTVTVNPDSQSLNYSPNPGFFGIDTFSYKIVDEGDLESMAAVLVFVNASGNSGPSAFSDQFQTGAPGAPYQLDVMENDTDPDSDMVSVYSISSKLPGTFSVQAVPGSLVYTPSANLFGGWDTFEYVVTDGRGAFAQGVVTLFDNSQPTLSITAPTGGSSVSGTVSVPFNMTQNFAVYRVGLYVDDQAVETQYGDAPIAFQLNTTGFDNGVHKLAVVAEYSKGVDEAVPNFPLDNSLETFQSKSADVSVTFNNLIKQFRTSKTMIEPAQGESVEITAQFTANANWNLTIEDDQGNAVVTQSGTGTSLSFTWDGQTGGGSAAPDGQYSASVAAANQATPSQNQTSTSKIRIGKVGTFGVAYQGNHLSGMLGLIGQSFSALRPPNGLGGRVQLPRYVGLPFGKLNGASKIAGNFAGAMTKAGWKQKFMKGDDDLKASDLFGEAAGGDNIWKDVNIGLLIGHHTFGSTPDFNWGGGIFEGCLSTYFPVVKGHFEYFPDLGTSLYLSTYDWVPLHQMEFGGPNMRWMGIWGCNVLRDDNFTSMWEHGALPINSDIGSQLHLLLGSGSTIHIVPDFGNLWAEMMTGTGAYSPTPNSIVESWVNAGYTIESVKYLKKIKPQSNALARIAGWPNCFGDQLLSYQDPDTDDIAEIVCREWILYDINSPH